MALSHHWRRLLAWLLDWTVDVQVQPSELLAAAAEFLILTSEISRSNTGKTDPRLTKKGFLPFLGTASVLI